jgi:hypothetical protein
MKRLVITLAFACACVSAQAAKQKLIVRAIDHRTSEYDYTATTPGSSETRCSVWADDSLRCHTTEYPAQQYPRTSYDFYESVVDEQTGTTYTLMEIVGITKQQRLVAGLVGGLGGFSGDPLAGQAMRDRMTRTGYTLKDGGTFQAEIKGGEMFVHVHNSNGKKKTLRFRILDIR